VSALTGLQDNAYHVLEGVKPEVKYTLSVAGMRISASGAKGVKFILPLIAGEVICEKGSLEQTDDVFFLTGGFMAKEYTFVPDANGELDLQIF